MPKGMDTFYLSELRTADSIKHLIGSLVDENKITLKWKVEELYLQGHDDAYHDVLYTLSTMPSTHGKEIMHTTKLSASELSELLCKTADHIIDNGDQSTEDLKNGFLALWNTYPTKSIFPSENVKRCVNFDY